MLKLECGKEIKRALGNMRMANIRNVRPNSKIILLSTDMYSLIFYFVLKIFYRFIIWNSDILF